MRRKFLKHGCERRGEMERRPAKGRFTFKERNLYRVVKHMTTNTFIRRSLWTSYNFRQTARTKTKLHGLRNKQMIRQRKQTSLFYFFKYQLPVFKAPVSLPHFALVGSHGRKSSNLRHLIVGENYTLPIIQNCPKEQRSW